MGAALVLILVGVGALAAGILVGRYYVPDDRMLKRTARHSRAYMRALNHLLAREHDIVIAELRRVVEENVDDAEPYFALGALFRTRGEHERAIRVHQALAAREAGNKKLRQRARYELGLDFRAAGMPRRATRAMEEVLADESRHEGALRALCGLYEEQGLFADAAEAWERLARRVGEEPSRRQHHLLCAAAQQALAAGDVGAARRLLKDARKTGDETAHFFAVAAELAAARNNPRGAAERLRDALALAPELATHLVPGLVAAERQELARKAGGDGGDGDSLEADLDDEAPALPAPAASLALPSPSPSPSPVPSPSPSPLDRLAADRASQTLTGLASLLGNDAHLRLAAAELRARVDPAAALTAYRSLADDRPELLPARVAAARLALASGDAAAIGSELSALAGPDGAVAWALDGVWRCSHCGYRSDSYAWRCPSCRRWSTSRRDLGREAIATAPPAPRERRERARTGRAAPEALLGGTAAGSLPPPALPPALAAGDVDDAPERSSPLGRLGRWISSPWSGKRGRGTVPSAEDS